MARVRTIFEAYQLLKSEDPNTRITIGMLRRWVADGTIPSIRAGRKILLNYDILLEYLSTPCASHTAITDSAHREIRPISAK